MLVQELDEFPEAAFVAEVVLLRLLRPLVPEDDPYALVQERHFPQAVAQGVVFELTGLEDAFGVLFGFYVRPELDGCTGAVRLADHLQVVQVFAPCVFLLVNLAVLVDGDGEVAAQRVYHAGADAVQAAGYFISPAAELAAGVQDRQADFHRGAVHLRMHAHREAAAVVHNGHGTVRVQRDVDLVAVPGQRLVHGVVHNLINQMVQAPGVRRADVHTGTLTDGFQAFEHLDLLFAVVGRDRGHLFHFKVHSFCHSAPRFSLFRVLRKKHVFSGRFRAVFEILKPLEK